MRPSDNLPNFVLSIDTNILLAGVEVTNKDHAKAAGFLSGMNQRDDVAISEFALVELYVLLRNPAVLRQPLKASVAAGVCGAFRSHPRWQVVGFPVDSRMFHNAFWPRLAQESFARRRAFDWRLALTLLRSGVTEFATVNAKDFESFGFQRVWNPLAR